MDLSLDACLELCIIVYMLLINQLEEEMGDSIRNVQLNAKLLNIRVEKENVIQVLLDGENIFIRFLPTDKFTISRDNQGRAKIERGLS